MRASAIIRSTKNTNNRLKSPQRKLMNRSVSIVVGMVSKADSNQLHRFQSALLLTINTEEPYVSIIFFWRSSIRRQWELN